MQIPSFRENPIFYIGILVILEQGIGQGTTSLTNVAPDAWIPFIKGWCNMLAFFGTTIMTAVAAPSAFAKPSATVTKVLAWLIVPIALAVLLTGPASAEPKKIGGPIGQTLDRIQGQQQGSGEAPASGGSSSAAAQTGGGLCDFNVLGALKAVTLLAQLKECIAAKGADDVKAALDSATASNDTVAIGCHKPALAIFQAAEGTPPPATAPPGTPNTSAGPILLFQKFREFVLAGGITNCKAWVTTTLAAGAPIQ